MNITAKLYTHRLRECGIPDQHAFGRDFMRRIINEDDWQRYHLQTHWFHLNVVTVNNNNNTQTISNAP